MSWLTAAERRDLDERGRDQLSLEVNDARPRSRLAERCPRCGAHPGKFCTTENGDFAATEHRERRRAAGYRPVTP